MTATPLIRRILFCCLALCVAGPGPSAYAFRPVEAEAETHAEEVAFHETARRQGVARTGQPVPATPGTVRAGIPGAAPRGADSVAAPPSLRALNVRIQV